MLRIEAAWKREGDMGMEREREKEGIGTNTVKPVSDGHPWDLTNWLLYKDGLLVMIALKIGYSPITKALSRQL